MWNGSIDWSAANNDLDFAIHRSSFEETTDNRFHEYASNCDTYGIPFGVYVYSYAESVAEAEAEARYAVSLVKNYEMMQLPIFFDAEDAVLAALSVSELRAVSKAFIDVVRESGYEAGIYTNICWFEYYYDTADFDSVAKWLAQIDGYYAAYAKLSDGTYVYSSLYEYSPKKYATSRLANSTNENMKALCVALLNYGAEAQKYFGYKTDDLMNAGLTDAQKALVVSYSADLFRGAIAADSAKAYFQSIGQ